MYILPPFPPPCIPGGYPIWMASTVVLSSSSSGNRPTEVHQMPVESSHTFLSAAAELPQALPHWPLLPLDWSSNDSTWNQLDECFSWQSLVMRLKAILHAPEMFQEGSPPAPLEGIPASSTLWHRLFTLFHPFLLQPSTPWLPTRPSTCLWMQSWF